MTDIISLVEVSPSTEIMLNVSSATTLHALRSISGLIAVSLVTKQSMVAILGWIIPLPLAIPPTVQTLPSRSKLTATSLRRVSVVIIASAASVPPSARSAETSEGIALVIGSSGSGRPITPVDAIMKSSSESFRALAALSHIACAINSPSALQVFALPELQRTAWAVPFSRCSCVTRIGAPLTLFWV